MVPPWNRRANNRSRQNCTPRPQSQSAGPRLRPLAYPAGVESSSATGVHRPVRAARTSNGKGGPEHALGMGEPMVDVLPPLAIRRLRGSSGYLVLLMIRGKTKVALAALALPQHRIRLRRLDSRVSRQLFHPALALEHHQLCCLVEAG